MISAIPQVVRHKPTGDLLITVKSHAANAHHGAGHECSPIDNRYSSRFYVDDDLEPAPARKHGAPYDFKTEIVPRAQGSLPWEHVEPANLAWVLSNIAACAGWAAYVGIAHVTKPGESHQSWARIFLHTTQGGGYTGQAHALVWERSTAAGPTMPSAWLLSICKHEVVDSSTPTGRSRGWHPAHCAKCGLNLSVDSSD